MSLLIQVKAFLLALASYFEKPRAGHDPISALYGRRQIDLLQKYDYRSACRRQMKGKPTVLTLDLFRRRGCPRAGRFNRISAESDSGFRTERRGNKPQDARIRIRVGSGNFDTHRSACVLVNQDQMEYTITSKNAVGRNIDLRPNSHRHKPPRCRRVKKQHSVVERLRCISSARDAKRRIAAAPEASMKVKTDGTLFGQGKCVIGSPQRGSEDIADSVLAAARRGIHFSHSEWKMMRMCLACQLAHLLCDATHQFRA